MATRKNKKMRTTFFHLVRHQNGWGAESERRRSANAIILFKLRLENKREKGECETFVDLVLHTFGVRISYDILHIFHMESMYALSNPISISTSTSAHMLSKYAETNMNTIRRIIWISFVCIDAISTHISCGFVWRLHFFLLNALLKCSNQKIKIKIVENVLLAETTTNFNMTLFCQNEQFPWVRAWVALDCYVFIEFVLRESLAANGTHTFFFFGNAHFSMEILFYFDDKFVGKYFIFHRITSLFGFLSVCDYFFDAFLMLFVENSLILMEKWVKILEFICFCHSLVLLSFSLFYLFEEFKCCQNKITDIFDTWLSISRRFIWLLRIFSDLFEIQAYQGYQAIDTSKFLQYFFYNHRIGWVLTKFELSEYSNLCTFQPNCFSWKSTDNLLTFYHLSDTILMRFLLISSFNNNMHRYEETWKIVISFESAAQNKEKHI